MTKFNEWFAENWQVLEPWRDAANWVYPLLVLILVGALTILRKSPRGSLGPWFTLKPPTRTREEVTGLRLLFAYVLWLALPPVTWVFQSGQPKPNGITHFVDLTFLANQEVWGYLHWLCLALIILYALGVALPVVVPLLFIQHLVVFTYTNSQGYIGHSMQLASMIVMAQMFGFTFWPLWMRYGRKQPVNSHQAAESAFSFTSQTIAASYVICGLTKLMNSEGRWIADIPNLAMQLQKTAKMDFYNTLTVAHQPLQEYMLRLLIEHPWQARVAFGMGLFLELAAIVALLGRRWELALGISVIVMHLVISEAMNLAFPFHLWVLFIFWVNPSFWLNLGLGYLLGRHPAPAEPAEPKADTRIISSTPGPAVLE